MSTDSSFEHVLEQLRKRDENAAARVFHRFQQQLIALADRHLEDRLASKLDPEDIIQSVFRSVFDRLAQGQFDLEGWDSLWGLLTCVTLRKCSKASEHFHAQVRNVDREVSSLPQSDQSDSGWEFLAREPTPLEGLTLAETLEEILRGLNDREQKVILLKLEGYNLSEIAVRVPCTFRKAKQVQNHVRGRLERMRDQALQGS
jgi:RNA polymerase sigma-70 factor (ECF subfamily)